MVGRHTFWQRNRLPLLALLMIVLLMCSACTQNNTATNGQSQAPIKIGVSVSLSGDFSADGKATEQGYQLWADTVNKNGGLLGRQVKLDFLSDGSNTTQVVTNYQKLITNNHDDLVFGPYSTLLTKPASVVANRYSYAMLEGSGGGPSVFTQGLHNIFDVTAPIVNQMDSFVEYILSLPANQRPQTVAYATEDDPFTQPMIDRARQLLEQGGVKTASYQVYPAETTDFTPIAQKIIASNAQLVVLGSMLPDATAYVQAFKQQHFNPKAIVASAGPDQGAQFTGPIGGASVAEGIFFPNAWAPGLTTYQNAQMVQDYIAKYGGTADQISADTAEAYAAGQVLAQAVNKAHSIDNKQLLATLHAGNTFQTLQGDVKFNDVGENVDGKGFTFQWQGGSVQRVYPASIATAKPVYPKPNWP
ncbi:branched-chain amino acid ABC transporter substrate-binding protein [Ktedonobacter sp. SOSP1-85]|uniref:amino acid ABC transporter substrate-binding protein n=1 Tax=Ktedonobacter sp. SOSP1-85 TaxID=2778367 RepID=UPI001914FB30|nr:amino acid ABC transporter substrate-binding protein [Ktedonobacter sp. SOSP1-85]GHO72543.1 branched-chain amino acid ABC transporter substrate-binding protein [Ktedonobacter sp. SOSP1-85]